jgi:hypothetical protein
MPGDDRLGFDDDERGPPVGPQTGNRDPEQAVGVPETQPPPPRPLKHQQLVTQREQLNVQGGP